MEIRFTREEFREFLAEHLPASALPKNHRLADVWVDEDDDGYVIITELARTGIGEVAS